MFLEPLPNYLTCIISAYGLLKNAVATDSCEQMFCFKRSSCLPMYMYVWLMKGQLFTTPLICCIMASLDDSFTEFQETFGDLSLSYTFLEPVLYY